MIKLSDDMRKMVDPAMAKDIQTALGKILSVLPPAARVSAESLALFAPAIALDDGTRLRLQTLREAVQSRNKLRMDYRDVSGAPSQRVVRPLGCFYWGRVWTFSAWCELRQDFRGFRIDRIDRIEVLPERFRDEPGKTLAEMLRRLQADPAELDGRPEAKNLVTIYSALADESVAEVLARFAGQGFGAFKPALAELAVETLQPIGARLAELQRDPAELDRLLAAGAEKARSVAAPTLKAAYAAMGL